MRGICKINTCSAPNETRKIHEEFEALHYGICWECGDKVIEALGENITGFKNIIQAIEKELL